MSEVAQAVESSESMLISGSGLEALTRSEIDIQVSTAKKYPRSIHQARQLALTMATIDPETAKDCFYKIPRQEKQPDGSYKTKMIEGPSVRLAEIFANAWGNMRVAARIIGEDERFVTAQGIAHDLQTNTAVSTETRRRITGRTGKKFGDDMIAVTGNAARSIALRDAIFRVIPKCYVQSVYNAAKQVATGDAKTLVQRRSELLTYYQSKVGIGLERILPVVGRASVNDIDLNDLETLHGMATAIRDGEISLDEAFPEPKKEDDGKKPEEPPKDKASALASELKGNGHGKPADKPAEEKTKEDKPVALDLSTWTKTEEAVNAAAQDTQLSPSDLLRMLNAWLLARGCKGKPEKTTEQDRLELVAAVREGRLGQDGSIREK